MLPLVFLSKRWRHEYSTHRVYPPSDIGEVEQEWADDVRAYLRHGWIQPRL